MYVDASGEKKVGPSGESEATKKIEEPEPAIVGVPEVHKAPEESDANQVNGHVEDSQDQSGILKENQENDASVISSVETSGVNEDSLAGPSSEDLFNEAATEFNECLEKFVPEEERTEFLAGLSNLLKTNRLLKIKKTFVKPRKPPVVRDVTKRPRGRPRRESSPTPKRILYRPPRIQQPTVSMPEILGVAGHSSYFSPVNFHFSPYGIGQESTGLTQAFNGLNSGLGNGLSNGMGGNGITTSISATPQNFNYLAAHLRQMNGEGRFVMEKPGQAPETYKEEAKPEVATGFGAQ